MKCLYCDGQLAETTSYDVHLASCPSAPKKTVRTKNDMLEALGSAFRLNE